MKIVFISNYLSAHQAPICNVLYKMLGKDFSFISLGKISNERKKLGMQEFRYDYNIELGCLDDVSAELLNLINTADVVICGNCPDSLIKDRLKHNKLTFKYVERLFKKKPDIKETVRAIIGTYIHYIRYTRFPFYVLCASAYTAGDINRFFKFHDRAFVWGYFPKYLKYDDIETVIDKKKKNSLLWVGRFLDWKHPEIPVMIADRLKRNGYSFDLSIAGIGDMYSKIENLIEEKNLGDCVHLLGAVNNNEVRRLMEQTETFLFTSDFYEGWGAVLNEAMNSGCVCFASHAIGSAPYLIKDGENGILFRNEDMDDLYEKLSIMLDNPEKKKRIARKAYETIVSKWNEEFAASRLIKLCEHLIKGEGTPFSTDVCSVSPLLDNDWYN